MVVVTHNPVVGSSASALALSPARELESSDTGILIGFVKGSILGGLVVFLVCAAIAVAAGCGLGPAVGIGAFAAFWGGPGFGGMMGAVLHHSHDQHSSEADPSVPVGS
jgi:hypothetical protein